MPIELSQLKLKSVLDLTNGPLIISLLTGPDLTQPSPNILRVPTIGPSIFYLHNPRADTQILYLSRTKRPPLNTKTKKSKNAKI